MLDLAHPFTGRWLTQNSPSNRVPSHGTARFASAQAVDFVPIDAAGRSARVTAATWFRTEPPERFVGFGRPILAPVAGTIVAVHDGEPDHDAHRGFPSVGYMLTQNRRASRGWPHLAGNHVMIETPDAVVALCHLQRGSIAAGVGTRVETGRQLALCGNSGNSTEPHLHLQAMSGPDPAAAEAIPFTLNGRALPRNAQVVDTEES
ncbi:M23 family metallopeptidase [Microbacterium halophytorum]|uniref:M23 family metallopeptidase n=1 Tax=Microbacterium halophytorum TaxID=2067568 RepID=UPI001E5E3962|nr:M23 family metallopeptidase [Microbacterium halophytorum]